MLRLRSTEKSKETRGDVKIGGGCHFRELVLFAVYLF